MIQILTACIIPFGVWGEAPDWQATRAVASLKPESYDAMAFESRGFSAPAFFLYWQGARCGTFCCYSFSRVPNAGAFPFLFRGGHYDTPPWGQCSVFTFLKNVLTFFVCSVKVWV